MRRREKNTRYVSCACGTGSIPYSSRHLEESMIRLQWQRPASSRSRGIKSGKRGERMAHAMPAAGLLAAAHGAGMNVSRRVVQSFRLFVSACLSWLLLPATTYEPTLFPPHRFSPGSQVAGNAGMNELTGGCGPKGSGDAACVGNSLPMRTNNVRPQYPPF